MAERQTDHQRSPRAAQKPPQSPKARIASNKKPTLVDASKKTRKPVANGAKILPVMKGQTGTQVVERAVPNGTVDDGQSIVVMPPKTTVGLGAAAMFVIVLLLVMIIGFMIYVLSVQTPRVIIERVPSKGVSVVNPGNGSGSVEQSPELSQESEKSILDLDKPSEARNNATGKSSEKSGDE